jgi:hypothetical protein
MSGMSPLDDAAGLERVTATLRRLPVTDGQAAERIVAAALRRQRLARRQRAWLAAAAGLALAAGAGVGGTLLYQRSGTPASVQQVAIDAPTADVRSAAAPGVPGAATTTATTAAVTTAPAAPGVPGTAQLAATHSGEEALVSMPFALRRPGARRVSLVGDFNAWSPTAIPMARGADGTWTATVHLTPGRHTYAFVVDDTVWVTDPRSEVVPDPDYGDGSR